MTEIGFLGHDQALSASEELREWCVVELSDGAEAIWDNEALEKCGELVCVGAGLGGVKKNRVFAIVPRDKVPKGAKIITSTWAMKKKASGVLRARLNARGFEQIDGQHFDSAHRSAPVGNEITIMIVLIIAVMTGNIAWLVDVMAAFLGGHMMENEKVHMHVPEGWAHLFPPNVVLLLLKTLYGTVQSAHRFWLETGKAVDYMGFEKSRVDPCLYYKWTDGGLVLWISWVDDYLFVGPDDIVTKTKNKLMEVFDCDDVGEAQEYVGCKLTRGEGTMTESR